ncbi:hypothetical protein ACFLRC_02075 [Candidatus Altiarchaeota archaeon]
MDLFTARVIVFLLVCIFSFFALHISPHICVKKVKKISGVKVFLPTFMFLILISAGAMLYVLTYYTWIVGYFVAVVMGFGTIKALESYGPKVAGSMGGLTLLFFYAASLNVSITSVILRDTATFISCLAIGIYFSRLITFRNLIIVSGLLAVYDFVAVFVTKHMVSLNVHGRDILPLITVPYLKEGMLMLPGTGIGSGDLIIIAALIGGTENVHGIRNGKAVTVGILVGFAFTYLGMSLFGIRLAPGLPGIVLGAFIGLWLAKKMY